MVRLQRTRAATFRYYLRTRAFRVSALAAALVVATASAVWAYPMGQSLVTGWASQLSGRDSTLSANVQVSDALTKAAEALATAPQSPLVDTATVTSLRDECQRARDAGDASSMKDCASRLTSAVNELSGVSSRQKVASAALALEKKAADAQAARDTAAAAAAQATADEAARVQAAADAAARQAAADAQSRVQAPQQSNPQPQPQPQQPAPPRSSGASLSTTVTCNARQTVTATATGGGTVTVSISGAGSAGDSGGGSATASATGQGTFTINASATEGGLSLNPSWTGACF